MKRLILSMMCLLGLSASAEITPSTVFTDDMVLQRGDGANIFGTAADGEKVTATIDGKSVETVAKTLKAIDALHALDPKKEIIDGIEKAAELVYAENMSSWLAKLEPDAGEDIQIAVRSQHLCRWEIARSEYPMDRPGYFKWRIELGKLHARKALEVMSAQGYGEEQCKNVENIIRKQKLKDNPDTQMMEDCACLVFIETAFLAFAAKHSEEKIIDIVQKTWAKMSEKAHQAALALELPAEALTIIGKALK